MSIYLVGLLWMAGSVVVASAGMILVRKFASSDHRRSSDEAASRVFTVVAGLEAVLLAFVLVSLFDAVGTAKAGSYTEADSLVSVYWDANLLPGPTSTKIQKLVLSYGNTVLNQEWPAMQDRAPITGLGKTQLDELHATIASFVPTTYPQEDRQTQLSNDLSSVYQARQQRMAAATARVSPLIWCALIVGAVLSVGLTCLFGGEKLWTHLVITSVLAGTVTVLLFATFQLQDPFSGAVALGPTAFASALSQLG